MFALSSSFCISERRRPSIFSVFFSFLSPTHPPLPLTTGKRRLAAATNPQRQFETLVVDDLRWIINNPRPPRTHPRRLRQRTNSHVRPLSLGVIQKRERQRGELVVLLSRRQHRPRLTRRRFSLSFFSLVDETEDNDKEHQLLVVVFLSYRRNRRRRGGSFPLYCPSATHDGSHV